MPKNLSINELFGTAPQAEDEDRVPTIKDVDAEADRTYSLDELFQAPKKQAAAPKGTAPYPVAPADAFGLPKGYEEPGFVTRFAEELPGVIGDIGQATKGVIRDTLWADMTDDEKSSGKRLFDDLREMQGTRASLQGAMQFTNTLHGVINRPLQWAGVEGADQNADQASRIVAALGQENQKKAAEGLIAQTLGETAGEISEGVISSLVEQYLGGRLLKGAKVVSPMRAAMVYTGISAGNNALTEASDMGLEGGKRLAYAGSVGAINSALIALGGAVAKKLGLETVEEALLGSEIKPMLSTLLSKQGVKPAMTALAKGLGGAGVEGGEEAFTAIGEGISKAAFDGEPEDAVKRVADLLIDKKFQSEVVKAGLSGVAARGAIGGMRNLSVALRSAADRLPGSLDKLAERVQTRKDRERLVAEEQATAPAPEPESAAAPAGAPTLAQGAPVAPQLVETPPTGEEVQGAPQAPAAPAVSPEAAQAAGTPAEPTAQGPAGASGDPPAAPPRTPPVEPEPAGVSPKNAAMATMAKRLTGRDIPYSADRVHWSDDIDTAIQTGLPSRARSLAQSVITTPRTLSSVETAGIAVRLVEIEQQYKAATSQLTAEDGHLTDAEALAQADLANDLESEFFMMREALLKAGTETGRALAARKMRLDDNYDVTNIMGRLYAAKKEPLTDAEKASIKQVVGIENKTSKQLAEAEQRVKNEVASEVLKTAKDSEPTVSDPAPLLSRLKELFDKGCDLA